MRTVVAATVAALLAAPPSCSFVFVKPPPPTDVRGTIVHCTASDAAPLVDVLVAAFGVLRFVTAYSATDADYANAMLSRNGTMLSGAFLFGVFAASSAVGFYTTSQCREALALANEDPNPTPRRRTVPRLNVAPAPREREPEESGVRDGRAPTDADAGMPSAVIAPEKSPAPAAPAARQRTDPE